MRGASASWNSQQIRFSFSQLVLGRDWVGAKLANQVRRRWLRSRWEATQPAASGESSSCSLKCNTLVSYFWDIRVKDNVATVVLFVVTTIYMSVSLCRCCVHYRPYILLVTAVTVGDIPHNRI